MGQKKKLTTIAPRCPACGSSQTYGRIKTSDYWCRYCKKPFDRTPEVELKVK